MWNLYFLNNEYFLEAGTFNNTKTESEVFCFLNSNNDNCYFSRSDRFYDLSKKVGLIRKAVPEDMNEILRFGYDAWNEDRDMEAFLKSYESSMDHLTGQRYLIENNEEIIMADLNTIRFSRDVVGIASVACKPENRREGWISKLLSAVILLLISENPRMKFLLFSEIEPDFYRRFGFYELPLQNFLPSVAMGRSESGFTMQELAFMNRYF
ncbi:GNAT family N-acetyltransferase [Myxococcota bacterium]|nr:GNAT family N-acetyltransferase [Myxococcota bacterium]MBU1379908.1 GNAT family N-acetyltransferase [Myxococcota bacterium]MBU1497858.1 GNAT family N-acetyltransferase [Myxococcota bacterium]